MKRLHPLLLSVSGGLLLWASWPVSPFTLLIFIAFVPFFWLEYQETGNRRFFFALFLGMLLWNIATTWWVCYASLPGGIVAMLFSSGFMSLPWLCFRFIKRKLGEGAGYLSLVAGWLSFEYIYLNIQLSWPWLTLGNVFASHPGWIQWYEYTGSSGGSLWVLLVNLFIFLLIKQAFHRRRAGSVIAAPADSSQPVAENIPFPTAVASHSTLSRQIRSGIVSRLYLAVIVILLAGPLAVSFLLVRNTSDTKAPGNRNVVIVQPNIDPYEKFNAATQEHQLRELIRLSKSAIDSQTALVVWPETALSGINGFNEDRLKEYRSLDPLWSFLAGYPRVTLYTGIESYKIYDGAPPSPTAHRIPDSHNYYDVFNSAALFNAANSLYPAGVHFPGAAPDTSAAAPITFYHKSKLVPGVEMLPTYLRFLDSWFEAFGGTSGGYAGQAERTVLEDAQNGYKIAPAICYESVYGEFLTAYIRNGANVIGIITNDGWWEDTPGYKQHNQYARLRAIETRRWVIRSANTGISCFIDPYGALLDPQPWDLATTVKRTVPMETRLTFFVKHGDIISRISLAVTGILILLGIVFSITKNIRKKQQ